MNNTVTVFVLLAVMAMLAYLALYFRNDGAKKGLPKPSVVLKYGIIIVALFLFAVAIVYKFF
ncbi:MAG: hypothetical protein ACLTWO_05845 [Blautia massiliensis (ex Durand et al. 2017)]